MSDSIEGSLSQEDLDSLLSEIEMEEGKAKSTEESKDGEEEVGKIKEGGGELSSGSVGEDIVGGPVVKGQTSVSEFEIESIENMALLLDVKMNVSVEIGRTKMLVDEVLELSSGAIVELDKLNGEYVDIMVNNRLIAYGEIVGIDGNFGVKIVDIVDIEDRLKFELS